MQVGIFLFLFWKDIKEHATGFITLIIIVLALYAISVAGTYIFGIIAVLAVCFAIYGIIKIIKSNINEKEKKRLEGIETQINEIKSKYTPKELPISINEVKSQITFDRLYINTEINKAVSEFKKSTRQLICECKTVDQKINKFLSYNSDPDSVLGYLSENIQEFEELKQQSDSLHARIDEKRIVLLNEDRDAIECIKQAFIKLKKSKKCSSDNIPISALVEGKKPLELNMFSYKYEPLVLSFNDCCYCFFGNVILVFDNEGTYLNALDPTVLRLSVERYVESVYKSDGNYQNSRNTDSDSHIVTAGETKQTWMHTRLDGYPDLRYSYNPKISHHTDEVMYGRVSFYLSEKISYTFSSYQAIMALEKAKSDYEKRYNDRRNALPDFLNLMQMLEPENAMLDDISKRCKAKSTSYFCKVT